MNVVAVTAPFVLKIILPSPPVTSPLKVVAPNLSTDHSKSCISTNALDCKPKTG